MPLYVADIYCGAGGLSAGFKDATARWLPNNQERFEIVFGVDIDTHAIETFRRFHFPNRAKDYLDIVAPCKDIKQVTAESIRNSIGAERHIDILIGGPNCQGVSAAGLRNPDDPRNAMLLSFIHLVEEMKPKWFVMENVPGLTHANNRELLADIFERLQKIDGYQVAGDVLLAADYGVPQLRYRLFIVGTNTGAPIRFPPRTHKLLKDQPSNSTDTIKPYLTVRDAIFDLSRYTPRAYEEHDLPNGANRMSTSLPLNHYRIELKPINEERIATVGRGQDWRYMPIHLLPERYFATRASDQKGAYGRLLWDWPAYTITNEAYNVTAGPFTHPEHNRPLSVREAARLQSFSDEHFFVGTVLSQYRQVGNAVPPELSRAVAEAIMYCHYQRDNAASWGSPGRITSDIVRKSLRGEVQFPTMTPRHAHPDFDLRQKKIQSEPRKAKQKPEPSISQWDANNRSQPNHEDLCLLRKLSEQPGNYRAAKRAKAIVQFIDNVDKQEIVKTANTSEASVKKWVDGYYGNGLDGWRAYHVTPDKISANDPTLMERLQTATKRARQILLVPSESRRNPDAPLKRLYMNDYLLKLINRFKDHTVINLIEKAEETLEGGLGTVYVGDLLVICNEVLTDEHDAR